MASPFAHLLRLMDALTVARMATPVAINGQHYPAVEAHFLPEMGPVSGNGLALVVFDWAYTPTHEDVVIWEGERYQIGRWQRYNGKAHITLEAFHDEGA
ncbi:hypothetical protein BK025_07825 [Sodalis sp. TME1]|nr:hypothetical protein BK025_07825 [Sodalis sp. TME1]